MSVGQGLPANEQLILSRIDNELYLGTPKGVYKIDQVNNRIVKSETFSKVIGEQQVYLLVQDNQKNVHVYTEDIAGFFKQISAGNYTFVPSSLFQLRYSFNNDLLNISSEYGRRRVVQCQRRIYPVQTRIGKPFGSRKATDCKQSGQCGGRQHFVCTKTL
jgi:ligand-binding sensor domain-containing protein